MTSFLRNSPSMLAGRVTKLLDGKRGYVLAPIPTPVGLEDADLTDFVKERVQEWKEEGFARFAVAEGTGIAELRIGDPAAVRYELGELCLRRLNEPWRALDQFREALSQNPEFMASMKAWLVNWHP